MRKEETKRKEEILIFASTSEWIIKLILSTIHSRLVSIDSLWLALTIFCILLASRAIIIFVTKQITVEVESGKRLLIRTCLFVWSFTFVLLHLLFFHYNMIQGDRLPSVSRSYSLSSYDEIIRNASKNGRRWPLLLLGTLFCVGIITAFSLYFGCNFTYTLLK